LHRDQAAIFSHRHGDHSQEKKMKLILLAHTDVADADLEPEDRDIAGTYAVQVADDVPLTQVASAALDGFHDHVAVGMLDDFLFTVHDADTGALLGETVDHDDYSLKHKCRNIEKISETLDATCLLACALPTGRPSLH
jgi:hypothetical protein